MVVIMVIMVIAVMAVIGGALKMAGFPTFSILEHKVFIFTHFLFRLNWLAFTMRNAGINRLLTLSELLLIMT
jgi:hypothetical protein